MGGSIQRLTGAESSELGGGVTIIPNVTRGLAGAFYPGIASLIPGSAAARAKMTKNYWNNGNGALVGNIGDFNAQPSYVGIPSGDCIDTLLTETANITFIIVAKAGAPSGVNGQFMGDWSGTAGVSAASLRYTSGNVVQMAADFNNAGATQLVLAALPAYADLTQWRMFCGRVTDGVSVDIWDLTAQAAGTTLRTTTATAFPRTLPFSNTVRIGASTSVTYQGAGSFCTAYAYDVALTDSEVLSQAAMLRTYAANRNISA